MQVLIIKITYVDDTLVYYRRHGANVTGVLEGINSKKDYLEDRIYPCISLINEFLDRYPNFSDKDEVLGFAQARLHHNVFKLFKYRYLAPSIAAFELVIFLDA